MSTSVNDFKKFVEFCSNKAQSGSATPSEFNLAAHRAQMQKFEMDFQRFLQDGYVTDYLTAFMKKKTLLIDTFGNTNLPSDYQHTASVRSYYVHPTKGGIEVEVTEETNFEFGKLQASQLFVGSKRFPKCSYFSTQMRFLPRDLGLAYLDYFFTPPEPIWNYTIVSNAEVFDPTGSVDFLWDSVYMNEIAGMYLSLISVNLKDGELQAFAEMYKQQN